MTLVKPWTDEQIDAFKDDIVVFEHKLAETGLFTDTALIALLDKHPSGELDVCTMQQGEGPYPNRFQTGDFRDCDGKTLLDAARSGKIWINIRRAMNIHPEYKSVLDEIYGNVADMTSSRPFKARGGILISSPIAKVPYHFDKTEVILWHVRGRKRVYVYPLTQDFIPDEAFENAVSNSLEDDLPYQAAFDKAAHILDLEPGQAAKWQLNAPHRVDNTEFCVSVTTEFSTRQSAMKNNAMIANATLRHRMGLKPSWSSSGVVNRSVKSVMGLGLRRIGIQKNMNTPDMVTFKIDPQAEGYIVPTEPFERNF